MTTEQLNIVLKELDDIQTMAQVVKAELQRGDKDNISALWFLAMKDCINKIESNNILK